MLYYLFTYLDKTFDFPGAGVFQYLSFRTAMAIIFSLIITLFIGKRVIMLLSRKQIGETIRDLGLKNEQAKAGTPTMGGLIILSGILVPTLLFAKLNNIYVILMLFTSVWLGLFGFIDDYIKVFKKDKKGLKGTFKIVGQVIAGLVVGITLYFNENVVIREKIFHEKSTIEQVNENQDITAVSAKFSNTSTKSTKTTIPFFKNNEADYAKILAFIGDNYRKYAYLIYIPFVILILTAVSNGANLTDGMDGLATGVSAIIGITLGILAWVSGNIVFADYLNIMYIPNTGELTIFIGAFVGSCIGFLWYNSYPAQVFMGDTGSLALGGIIAVFAIIIRKEILIPLLCGIFFAESLSVVMQVVWFKYTRFRHGEGRRIFKMSPLHHHYQVLGYPEPKIVLRFLIVGIMLAVISIITLKLR